MVLLIIPENSLSISGYSRTLDSKLCTGTLEETDVESVKKAMIEATICYASAANLTKKWRCV